MSSELKNLSKQIEELRHKLHALGETKGLRDPEVIAVSKKLDAVLAEFYRVLKKEKKE